MKKQYKILIVEDDSESADLLIYFLKPENYIIEVATDGKQALEVLERYSPDIILLDVMMPEIDGFSVCKKIKDGSITRHIPVIMLTALKELKDRIKAIEAGADDFITKPFDSLELLARVRSLLKTKTYFEELQETNKELKEKNQILEKEDKLKKDLIHLIVHDMKNPLFVIQGNLQMMGMNKQFKTSPVQKYIHRIERSSRNLLRMILNLLDISRLEQNKVELNKIKTNINKIVTDKIEYFHKVGDVGDVDVGIDIPDEIAYSMLDQELFERVLDNLISFILVNSGPESKYELSMKKEDGKIFIDFFHEGNVISDEYKDKVFLKHCQTELKKAGFKVAKGLGLIFCKSALNLMDADIMMKKNIENGNLFRIVCKEVN
ncbi:MAG: hybrid sensor histidine kinase/response regulator [Calditrichia bacterium]|nr:hybrid sensor histidine kinase/response regulator [Calditrichia bacterium]